MFSEELTTVKLKVSQAVAQKIQMKRTSTFGSLVSSIKTVLTDSVQTPLEEVPRDTPECCQGVFRHTTTNH